MSFASFAHTQSIICVRIHTDPGDKLQLVSCSVNAVRHY